MDIFEQLENLNVSEECFKDVMDMVSNLFEEFEIEMTLDDLIQYDKEHPPKSYEDTMKEWNKEYKKNTTKNQRGEFDTKKKQFPKSYRELGNAYGKPDKAEIEAERAERRSIARHKKKAGLIECLESLNVSEDCFDDIMNMVEELLSEGTHLAAAVDRYAKKRGYLVPNYTKLRDKALALPGTNDFSFKEDKNGKLTIYSQGDSDKNKSKDERGQEKNDERHAKFGRSKEELENNREKN